jgi:hypothetical protein
LANVIRRRRNAPNLETGFGLAKSSLSSPGLNRAIQ